MSTQTVPCFWLLLFLLASGFASTPKPIASIDVAAENGAFQKSDSRFALAFPSADQIAIVSVDGRTPARQTAPDENKFHLRIDFLRFSGNYIGRDGHLEFPTNSDQAGAIFLSSGRFILNDAHDLMLFDRNRVLIKRKTVEEVCQRTFSKLALLSATLIPGSEKVAVLGINEHFGEWWSKIDEWWKYSNVPPKRKVVNYEDFCWFSTENLELLARGGDAPYGDYRPARDEIVTSPLRTLITPEGKRIGDAAQIRATMVRQQKTDRRDAADLLELLVADALRAHLGAVEWRAGSAATFPPGRPAHLREPRRSSSDCSRAALYLEGTISVRT